MTKPAPSPGPLNGVKVIELGGAGPAPFATMTMAELGAEIIRVDRPGSPSTFPPERHDLLNRGKRSMILDLKDPRGVAALRSIVRRSDVLVEAYRPGVAERLGVGPTECRADNPALVYARMTGWGQHGPLASSAGHDITYLAITGVLYSIGSAGLPPQIPLNLLGDVGGGAMYLLTGILAALLHVERTGEGDVVDAAIVDGVTHMAAGIHSLINAGLWDDHGRGLNLLDGGAPFYAIYETADRRHMAVGAIESRFYREFLSILGLENIAPIQFERATWDETRRDIAAAFAGKTLIEWTTLFEGTDACVAPVLTIREAAAHPHLRIRRSLTEHNGLIKPSGAPRFQTNPNPSRTPPARAGQHTIEVLDDWEVENADELIAAGVATQTGT